MPDFGLQSLPWVFYLAGVFISCFSSFLLAGKRKKVMADYILAAWFMIIGIHLILFILFFSGSYIKFPYFLGYEVIFPFIHGPMLYLYVLSVTGKAPGRKIWLLHFVPVLIVFVMLFKLLILSPWDRLAIYQSGGSEYQLISSILKYMMILSGIVYIVVSFFAVRKYTREIAEQYSNTERINLRWLYYLIAGLALIWVAVMIRNDILIFFIVVLFIIVAAYFGISRVGILDLPVITVNINEEKVDDEVIKYQKNFPGEDAIIAVYEKLIYQMEKDSLYKDPELSLNHTAALLEVHPNILSQAINSIENKNFYDYINRQRIEEFKRLAVLPENRKYTILSLAFESGFNSKTSFNRNFKKYMNCSPRDFLKSQSIENEM
ncbi:AraC-like DNA-binding protein [Chryseobacterium bernardetii]|uniref:Helix-turn-helix protein n=2 Tax=Chryseobacterium TaxID=59732 RepID=A0A543ECA9_9FLAO|nr:MULTISPECIES: helix-turn-helix domain-containing protein [Chryseobacterium]MDR6372583.1 AraC-like DNA-binding protein [Chryseobacterium vietnamense]MDR6442801.1 AraC-like DNA-binding protein [Chryseobacterium bernardetii]TQM19223.1 helix-turn-helix protein [Chryseobacterium aquifrigidense]